MSSNSDLATMPIPELVAGIREQDFDGNFLIELTMNILANRMAAQHERIEELERERPQWISVEDELPPVGPEILLYGLVSGDYGYTEDEWRTVVGVCTNKKAQTYSYIKARHDGYFRVTHWVPLPEPPEGATTP